MGSDSVVRHTGRCHCGAVRFEVDVDAAHGSRCNCTLCIRINALSAIVKPADFRLLAGEDKLSRYGTPIGSRAFCATCGVHCFGNGNLPELGGDYVSVNLQTFDRDDFDPFDVHVTYWDGRHNNWESGPRETPWPVHAKPRAA